MKRHEVNAQSPKPHVVNIYRHEKDRLPSNELLQINVSKNVGGALENLESGLVVIRLVDIFSELDTPMIAALLDTLRGRLSEKGVLHIEEPLDPSSNQQLTELLQDHGFPVVQKDTSSDDTDEGTIKKFTVEARSAQKQHWHDALLFPDEFHQQTQQFRQSSHADVSWIITVYNEEAILPHFLSFLEAICDETAMRREFIFVVNGCTDSSEEILQTYCRSTKLDARVISSEVGILRAYKKGIASRNYTGYVGRLDADIFLHPHTLDLMQMHLSNSPEVKVTYAEPLPLEAPNEFNVPYHQPATATERLYYTGKTHLFKEDPYQSYDDHTMPKEFIADDIFLSFYLIYYYGFESISRTPHAVVYERVVGSFDDLVMQFSRANSEITRIMKRYPHFKVLDALVEQRFSDGPYKNLTDKAKASQNYVEGWTRLETTK